MTKLELKDFLECSDFEIDEIAKYAQNFFGDFYFYLIKKTIINYHINLKTLNGVLYIFYKMKLYGDTTPEIGFEQIGQLSINYSKPSIIAGKMLTDWASRIISDYEKKLK